MCAAILYIGHATAAEPNAATATPPITDDPGCIMKRPSSLCALADGGGGVCTPMRCAAGQPCLQCVAAPLNSPETRSYTMFIVVGTLIFLGGLVFVFRLRKNWK